MKKIFKLSASELKALRAGMTGSWTCNSQSTSEVTRGGGCGATATARVAPGAAPQFTGNKAEYTKNGKAFKPKRIVLEGADAERFWDKYKDDIVKSPRWGK